MTLEEIREAKERISREMPAWERVYEMHLSGDYEAAANLARQTLEDHQTDLAYLTDLEGDILEDIALVMGEDR